MAIVIYHNPQCGTSRKTLARIKQAGIEPIVIEYLKQGWTKPQLQTLFAVADISAGQALRRTHSPAEELNLLGDDVDEHRLLDAMVEYPILVNRPFVCSAKGVRLCRPAELVDDLL